MLTWRFNDAQLLKGLICRLATSVLPVAPGCECSITWRLLGYVVNVKLSNCRYKQRICLDGKPDSTSKSLCGTPVVSTDLYGRFVPSTVSIGLSSITGWLKVIPLPSNQFLSFTPLVTNLNLSLTLQTGLRLPNITNSINITDCDVVIGGTPCKACSACDNGKGINFTCTNVDIIDVKLLNQSITKIKLPIPTTCVGIPGF